MTGKRGREVKWFIWFYLVDEQGLDRSLAKEMEKESGNYKNLEVS